MGRLTELHVENFKSYKGKQLCAFGDFTAIIGPNGSGKSNLLDALGFVLGSKPAHLRSSNLKELIYKSSDGQDESEDAPKVAKVTGFLATGENQLGEVLEFTRSINHLGISEYRINGKKKTVVEYKDALAKENILTDAGNFAVFQGNVESISTKTPQELSDLIEQISGSKMYKDSYDKLEREYREAAEQTTAYYNKKRILSGETKALKQNQAVIEKLDELKQEHANELTNCTLWRMKMLDIKAAEIKNEIEKYNSVYSDKREILENIKKSRQNDRLALETHTAMCMELVKVLEAQETEENQMTQSLMLLEGQQKYLQNDIKSAENHNLRAKNQYEEQVDIINKLNKDLNDMKGLLKKQEEVIESEKLRVSNGLSNEVLDKYNQHRKEIQGEIESEERELACKNAERKSIQKNIENTQFQVRLLGNKCKSLESNLDEVSWMKERLISKVKEQEYELEVIEQEENNRLNECRKLVQQEKEITEEISEIQAKLQECQYENEESARGKKKELMMECIRRAIPGVHGTIKSLCHVKNSKYQVAISTALGSIADAMVVDSQITAVEAIQYIKEQRLGYCVFLPMTGLKSSVLNEALRNNPESTLAVDAVAFDQIYTKIFRFVLGNVLIFETNSAAIRYRPKDVVAVTLDGTIFHKNGTITGGKSSRLIPNVPKMDPKIKLDLVEKEKILLEKLQETSKSKFRLDQENSDSLAETIQGKKLTIATTKEEIRMLESNSRDLNEEKMVVNSDITQKTNYLNEQQKLMEDNEKIISLLQMKIKKSEDKIKEFFDKDTLVQIAQYNESLSKIDELEEAYKNCYALYEKLENRFKFEVNRKTNLETKLNSGTSVLKNDNRKLSEITEKIKFIKVNLNKIKIKNISSSAKLKFVKADIEEYEKKCKRYDDEVSDLMREMENVARTITANELKYEKTYLEKSLILLKAQLEDINVPLVDGFLKDVPRSKLERIRPLMDTNMDTSTNRNSLSADCDTVETRLFRETLDSIKPDYAQILHIEIPNTEEGRQLLEKKFSDRCYELSNEIDKLAPNIKSVNRLDMYISQLKDADHVFQLQQKKLKILKEKFDKIKKERTDSFMDAFNFISGIVDTIYKELTKSRTTLSGGSAYFILQNADDPIAGGIKYHIMPPMKRFRDMEFLSGGERTVASLALLFAAHSYKPSPMLILDEIDAALDNYNVARVANYLSKHASRSLQFIIVSLKSMLYEKAHELIGVYRDKNENSSKTLTLKLKDNYL